MNGCYGNKTWCVFGDFCKNSKGCEKVLTQEVKLEALQSNALLVTFVKPPKVCFEYNGKRQGN